VPNLLQALRQRAPAVEPARHVTSVDDYLQTINQLEFAYNGITYTPDQLSGLTGTYGQVPHEAISHEFENYCQAAYAANGVVFAVMLARKLAFSAVGSSGSGSTRAARPRCSGRRRWPCSSSRGSAAPPRTC
jgi:hypothetical protein